MPRFYALERKFWQRVVSKPTIVNDLRYHRWLNNPLYKTGKVGNAQSRMRVFCKIAFNVSVIIPRNRGRGKVAW